jgi:hypothetical protein
MEIGKIQKRLESGKNINSYNEKDIEYMKTPIGKTIYKNAISETINTDIQKGRKRGRKKLENPTHWSDKIICKVCDKSILRSNQSTHKKSNYHLAHLKFLTKAEQLLRS